MYYVFLLFVSLIVSAAIGTMWSYLDSAAYRSPGTVISWVSFVSIVL